MELDPGPAVLLVEGVALYRAQKGHFAARRRHGDLGYALEARHVMRTERDRGPDFCRRQQKDHEATAPLDNPHTVDSFL